MEIFIDGQLIEFTLEEEKTLSQVYKALSHWLEGQGGKIVGIQIDGKPQNPHNPPEWGDIPLESISTLDLSTKAKWEQDYQDLQVILEYFFLLERGLIANEWEPLKKILSEYPYVRAGLSYHLKDLFGPVGTSATKLDEIAEGIHSMPDGPGRDELAGLLEYVRKVIMILKDRILEITDPEKEAAITARLLLLSKEAIEKVPILLQMGKDREAMQNILSYTEPALKAMRLLSYRRDETEEISDFCRRLNGVLGELSQAFAVKDSVLVGDLLEYEIAPRTDRLVELLHPRTHVEKSS